MTFPFLTEVKPAKDKPVSPEYAHEQLQRIIDMLAKMPDPLK